MEKIETFATKPEFSFLENDIVNLILTFDEESKLDGKIKEVEDFMVQNAGKNKSDDEKDRLYKEAQVLWHNFVNGLKEAKYNFYLNRPQHKFLTDLLLSKLEYDVNTVFFAIELTNMLGSMKEAKFTNDAELVAFPVNATEITYIYHLISKHKVKGLTRDSYTFSKVLLRIGDISKIFNYYESYSKHLSKEIQDWVAAFEEGVNIEGKTESIEAQVLNPEA